MVLLRALVHFLSLSIAIIGLAANDPVFGQETTGIEETIASAEELFERWDDAESPGVAVAVMADGMPVWNRGFGLADMEQRTAISPGTRFHAASISKQFTAFAILTLVDEGAVGLDDDIREILPALAHLPEKISVSQLLDHTSGVREVGTLLLIAGWLPDDIVTQQQQYNMISGQLSGNFQPGQHVEYSNTGYALLARIVEAVSEDTFDVFLRTRIFEPLGMNDTLVQVDRNALIVGLARSYIPTRGGLLNSHLNREIVGSTGIITTAVDLIKWAENFQTKTIGNDRVFALMAERTVANDGQDAIFARGQEMRRHNGIKVWVHGGRIAGYRTFLLRAPEQNFSVAILSNRGDFDAAAIAFAVTDLFLEDSADFEIAPEEAWEAATTEELESYSGLYELFPGAIFDISHMDGRLQFSPYGSGQTIALEQSGQSEFILNAASDIRLSFVAEPDLSVAKLEYVLGLNGSLIARRREVSPHSPDDVDLVDFTGLFSSEELGTRYEFRMVDGMLTAFHARLEPFVLTQLEVDTFTAPSSGLQEVRFVRGSDGQVTGADVSAALAENIAFVKTE